MVAILSHYFQRKVNCIVLSISISSFVLWGCLGCTLASPSPGGSPPTPAATGSGEAHGPARSIVWRRSQVPGSSQTLKSPNSHMRESKLKSNLNLKYCVKNALPHFGCPTTTQAENMIFWSCIFGARDINSYYKMWLNADAVSKHHTFSRSGLQEIHLIRIYERRAQTTISLWDCELLFQGIWGTLFDVAVWLEYSSLSLSTGSE